MIPMFMNCEHLGAFCVFVCYALFVMFNYYPFYVTLCPFPYCSITSLNRISCGKRIKPTVGGLGGYFFTLLQFRKIAALVLMYFVAFLLFLYICFFIFLSLR